VRLPSPSIAFPVMKSSDGGRRPFSPSLAGSFAAWSRWIRGSARSRGHGRDAGLGEASSDNSGARNELVIKTPISAGKLAPPWLSPCLSASRQECGCNFRGARAVLGVLVYFERCWCNFGDAGVIWGMLVQFSGCLSSFGDACPIWGTLIHFWGC